MASSARTATRPGTYRVPDILETKASIIGEVKNVRYQYYSRQIKDYVAFAVGNNYRFVLMVRQGTQLSAQLQSAIDDGRVILQRTLR